MYHGPKEEVVPFFEGLGFRLPPRKGTADFLQEITSRKDQRQYWADPSKPYRFIPPAEMARAFHHSPVGQAAAAEAASPPVHTKEGLLFLAQNLRLFRLLVLNQMVSRARWLPHQPIGRTRKVSRLSLAGHHWY